MASLLGVLLQVPATVLLAIAVGVERLAADGGVPWWDLVRLPFGIWVAYHGASGGGFLLMGFVWIWVAFALARRQMPAAPPTTPTGSDGRTHILAIAAMSGAMYGAIAFSVALLLRLTGREGLVPLGGGLPFAADPASTLSASLLVPLVFGGLIGFALAVRAFLQRAGSRVGEAIPALGGRADERLRAAWSGVRAAYGLAVPAMAAFLALGGLVAVVTEGAVGADDVLAILALLLAGVLLAGFDAGMAGLIVATRLFVGSDLGLEVPGWEHLSIIVPLVAFARGGFVAAREAGATRREDAVRVGVLVGLLMVPLGAAFALVHADLAGGGLIASAILLPALWGSVLGVAGAIYRVTQVEAEDEEARASRSLDPAMAPSNERVRQARWVGEAPDPPMHELVAAPRRCASCGSTLRADDRFCARCGREASPEEAGRPSAP
jgi:hypothetical protein